MTGPRPLDAEALALFARKGREGGPHVPQAGEANGVKVRRVMQLIADLAPRPFHELRILDLGCGEGVYAIEAGLRGAHVLAIDARPERMNEGAAVARRHGLENVRFVQEDVRRAAQASHGAFDVVLLLGLLYHLDADEALALLERAHAMCTGLLVVDTLVSLAPDTEVRGYGGQRVREHEDEDPPETRRARLLRSIDNTFAFRFTRESLVRALGDAGFTSVLECHAPLEPGKAEDRITLAARKGEAVSVASYPWVNGASEEEIARRIDSMQGGVRGPLTTVAFFCMREPGHFQRMRSLFAGMPALGMRAVVFTHRDFRGYVERAGATFVDLFAKYPPADADATSLPVPCRHVSFAGRYADDVRRDLEALGTSLVVYDTFAVVGFVVARLLGVPYVNVCAGHNVEPSRFTEMLKTDPRVKIAPECHRAVETLRTRHGIADASPFSYVTALSPHLNVYCEPPEFLDGRERRPFEPITFHGSLPSLEEPFDPVEGAEPVAFLGKDVKVYVSFGTIVWRYYAKEALKALGAISEAIAARPDAEAVISLGGAEVDASSLARPNVRVASYVDQRRVLAEADVYVTHQGLNSTHEAIFHGVPMLSYPFFWDQPALARKCQGFGLALPLAKEPRAAIGPDEVDAALGEAAARRAKMKAALAKARGWEEAVMANRSSVLRRIAKLRRG